MVPTVAFTVFAFYILLSAFKIWAGLDVKRCLLARLETGQWSSLPAAGDLELCPAFLGPNSRCWSREAVQTDGQ